MSYSYGNEISIAPQSV